MPYAATPDQVKPYFEEVGEGVPILFVHKQNRKAFAHFLEIKLHLIGSDCVRHGDRFRLPGPTSSRIGRVPHRPDLPSIVIAMRTRSAILRAPMRSITQAR